MTQKEKKVREGEINQAYRSKNSPDPLSILSFWDRASLYSWAGDPKLTRQPGLASNMKEAFFLSSKS